MLLIVNARCPTYTDSDAFNKQENRVSAVWLTKILLVLCKTVSAYLGKIFRVMSIDKAQLSFAESSRRMWEFRHKTIDEGMVFFQRRKSFRILNGGDHGGPSCLQSLLCL